MGASMRAFLLRFAQNPTVTAVLSGILVGIPFVYAPAWPLLLVGFVPLLHVLSGLSPKQRFWHGYLFGCVYFSLAFLWVWHSLPLDWLGTERSPVFSVLLIALTCLIGFSFFSLFTGAFAFLYGKLRTGGALDLLFIPLLWGALEFLRAVGLSLLAVGEGSLFGSHFTMGFIGYPLASSETLLLLAYVGDVYLLSFFVLFCNTLVVLVLRNGLHTRILLGAGVGVGMFLLLIIYTHSEIDAPYADASTIKVAATNTYFESSFRREDTVDRFLILRELVEGVRHGDVDLLVFPEDQRFLATHIQQGSVHDFFAPGLENAVMVGSSRVSDGDGDFQRIFAYHTGNREVKVSDKQFLTLQGEYAPWLFKAMLFLMGRLDVAESFASNRAYVRGSLLQPLVHDDVRIGGIFCSEVMSPFIVNKLASSGSNVLVVVASQARFHGSRVLHTQLQHVSQVRAVSHNQYLVYASNGSPSYMVNNRGEVIETTENANYPKETVLFGEVQIIK